MQMQATVAQLELYGFLNPQMCRCEGREAGGRREGGGGGGRGGGGFSSGRKATACHIYIYYIACYMYIYYIFV